MKAATRALLPVLMLLGAAIDAAAQEGGTAQTPMGANIIEGARRAVDQDNVSTTLIVVFIVTVISLAPAILVMTTSFTRVIVVLGFLRQALGTQQTPPNQVLLGLALFLTFFIMMPTYQRVNEDALQPYMRGEIATPTEALERAVEPVREFMFRQARPADIKLFLDIARLPRPDTTDDVPTHVLIPAFVISELNTAFQIGFLIYIPFLIIDMVVASTLMAMGMMMLPPIFVSLPFKIIMFVLVDGWNLLIGSLARSFA